MVILKRPEGVSACVTIVIDDEKEGLPDMGANRISVAAGTSLADKVTSARDPEREVTIT